MRFSERIGLVKPREVFQKTAIDTETKNQIWNIVSMAYWSAIKQSSAIYGFQYTRLGEQRVNRFWHNFIKKPIDEIPDGQTAYEFIKTDFFNGSWNNVYDHIQFVYDDIRSINTKSSGEFIVQINSILDREKCYYHFIGELISPRMNESEEATIEVALKTPYSNVHEHLHKALNYYSDRTKPDYPECIQESICAVEALCKTIANDGSKTLSQSLPEIKKKLNIPQPLIISLDNIFGYRNVATAHGKTPEEIARIPKITSSDAQHIFVMCSSWINYLASKMDENGR